MPPQAETEPYFRGDSVPPRGYFGLMAEWLGKGLQNLVQRFESASDLTETALRISVTLFYFEFVRYLYGNRKNECKDYAFFIVGIF